MPGFLYGQLDYDVVNFRIWVQSVREAIRGTKCESRSGNYNGGSSGFSSSNSNHHGNGGSYVDPGSYASRGSYTGWTFWYFVTLPLCN